MDGCLILTNLLMCYYDQNLLATTKLTLVNMSTLAALQPFPSWSLYCAMKASREMFFKTLAIEREQDGNIKVLNYAPGPVDTNVSIVTRILHIYEMKYRYVSMERINISLSLTIIDLFTF